ncbi:Protein transport protein sec73 [Tolypocladium capitatum]|uniref:Protein transport protein sec73 n=1 Tax=Tolypocladium capitatum TaxID=45235 RepID=A0A2K3QKG4_9HYPO|nr:Protein transport protein sec73 [Tolypocladium capitatum]
MPSLRRRGNVVSETDMRRHTMLAPRASADGNGNGYGYGYGYGNGGGNGNGGDDDDSGVPAPLPRPPSTQRQQQLKHNQNQKQMQMQMPLPPRLPPPIDHVTAQGTLSQLPGRESESESAASRPDTPPVHQETNKHRRFSVLRFRNASDSQLSLRAKQQAEKPPPVPRRIFTSPTPLLAVSALLGTDHAESAPAIVTTAPTNDIMGSKKMASRMSLAAKFRHSNHVPRDDGGNPMAPSWRALRKSFNEERGRSFLAALDEPPSPRPSTQSASASNGTTLNTFTNRQSESSRSDESSADRISHPSPTTTPKRSQASTPLFKLRRAKKTPEPMFPLAHLPQKNATHSFTGSSASLGVGSMPRPASVQSATTPRAAHADRFEDGSASQTSPAAAFFAPGTGLGSGHSSPTRANLLRGRSSTMSSMDRNSTDDHLLPPTTRTSTSTGRKSFGDLFGLSRIRQNSELSRQGSLTPATPASITSKSNSLQLPRGSIVLPERRDDESPAKYLTRVEDVVGRGVIAAALSKGTDPFSAAVLRSYMRSFSFFGDPMDMAIRKLLMEAELPKETQQIDRCLQAFANRYHECNPGIYSSPDQAYFIAFSLLILHTDVFNKNNKHKMQKADYLKNTRGEGIFDDILECFYDNISYTPFIHVEDDLDLSQERIATNKSKKKQLLSANTGDPAKRAAKEPIDPYTLILDGNLDALRPNLKDAMHLDDHYNYLGTAACLNLQDLQKTFFKTGVLQIVSARSRPDAFMSEKTAINPEDAHPGIVDIKITKVGLLWRKDPKKRKTRSPWQEWGAILTGAQLYFFRNTSWVKNLMHQYENHIRAGHDGIPIIFNPPLEEFKPDALMSTHGAVALVDTTYKKHKNAFVYVRQGGLDEVLLADNEDELNDWLAKLNYAAAFRTSGVRMRGVVGGNYDGQGRRGIRRLDGSEATQLIQTPTGPVSIARGRIDHKMAEDIQTARRDGLQRKIAEAERKVEETQRQLEGQLRNARHLQILAPIQPRTREQLLSAAARMAAQLKWTRMEIWRETCHRDILVQDLADDRPASASMATPTKNQAESEPASPSTPRPLVTPLEPKSKQHSGTDKSPQTPTDPGISRVSSAVETAHEVESPSKPAFQTPPQSAAKPHRGQRDASHSASDVGSTRHASISSVAASPVQSPTSTPQARQTSSRDGRGTTSSSKSDPSQDDVDADERDFLKQAGLWEARSGRAAMDKATLSTSAEKAEHGTPAERDKLEKNKIRRSLQRTLREGAGHLSHHRSRKGKEIAAAGASEDTPRDTMLFRGTGSFVVHGKKASVINLGTELQSMSQDDKILARKQLHQQQLLLQQQLAEQPPVFPVPKTEPDDDSHSALEAPSESNESSGRRESTASASTATARSFRLLHRKYSSAQAVRSASAGGRLAVPSDGESEVAVSFSDGRKSPLPPIEKGSENEVEDDDDDDDDDDDEPSKKVVGRAERNQAPRQEQKGEDSDDTDEESLPEPDNLTRRPAQAVNA